MSTNPSPSTKKKPNKNTEAAIEIGPMILAVLSVKNVPEKVTMETVLSLLKAIPCVEESEHSVQLAFYHVLDQLYKLHQKRFDEAAAKLPDRMPPLQENKDLYAAAKASGEKIKGELDERVAKIRANAKAIEWEPIKFKAQTGKIWELIFYSYKSEMGTIFDGNCLIDIDFSKYCLAQTVYGRSCTCIKPKFDVIY